MRQETIGTFALSILVVAGLVFLTLLFIRGSVWLSEKVLPIVYDLAGLACAVRLAGESGLGSVPQSRLRMASLGPMGRVAADRGDSVPGDGRILHRALAVGPGAAVYAANGLRMFGRDASALAEGPRRQHLTMIEFVRTCAHENSRREVLDTLAPALTRR
jgi:hypothetical protein